MVNIALGGPRGPLGLQLKDADVKRVLDEAESAGAGLSDINTVAIKSRDPTWAIVQYAEENDFHHVITGTGDRSSISAEERALSKRSSSMSGAGASGKEQWHSANVAQTGQYGWSYNPAGRRRGSQWARAWRNCTPITRI